VLLIADTSVLINFLKIDRISLLGKHSPRCAITDHVLAEITDFYPDQQSRLNAAIHEAYVEVTPVTADAEIDLFARLQGLPSRPLGAGECSAIAVALTRGYSLAMDDRLGHCGPADSSRRLTNRTSRRNASRLAKPASI
jgi:predicted nucleic acid-binding protein